jgi:hypothetical protein
LVSLGERSDVVVWIEKQKLSDGSPDEGDIKKRRKRLLAKWRDLNAMILWVGDGRDEVDPVYDEWRLSDHRWARGAWGDNNVHVDHRLGCCSSFNTWMEIGLAARDLQQQKPSVRLLWLDRLISTGEMQDHL